MYKKIAKNLINLAKKLVSSSDPYGDYDKSFGKTCRVFANPKGFEISVGSNISTPWNAVKVEEVEKWIVEMTKALEDTKEAIKYIKENEDAMKQAFVEAFKNKKTSSTKVAWDAIPKSPEQRNKSWYDMVTSFAPKINMNCRLFAAHMAEKDKSELTSIDHTYLMFSDPRSNSNKYHFYVIYYYENGGKKMYIPVNCSGRIGFIERTYCLSRYPVDSLGQAESAINAHMRTKLAKGYLEINLRRG